ncbi:MAG TPA: gamma carbonic anhydrase family protein [Candidatus Lokiarchaeia archaeon]|nr:gamma carbonic anhydrase family protein [Candidatus Lokiarchaeia archaeon]
MIMPNHKGVMPKIHETAFIAPGATIIGDVEIGEGTNVWPGAVIRGDMCKIRIGKHCSIQDNCVIHSEAGTSITIGDNVLMGHGAIVHGPGDIGDNNLVGIGSIKLMKKTVGTGCIIGAGALITKDVEDFSKMMGSPAEVKGTLEEKDTTPKATGSENYYQMGQAYKKQGLDQREYPGG